MAFTPLIRIAVRRQNEAPGVESKLASYPMDTIFVTYCAGPHCNGATRGAIRLAQLGRPVKVMRGGITGWLDERFPLVGSDDGQGKFSLSSTTPC